MKIKLKEREKNGEVDIEASLYEAKVLSEALSSVDRDNLNGEYEERIIENIISELDCIIKNELDCIAEKIGSLQEGK